MVLNGCGIWDKMEKHEDNLDKLLKAELEKEAGEIMEEMDSD